MTSDTFYWERPADRAPFAGTLGVQALVFNLCLFIHYFSLGFCAFLVDILIIVSTEGALRRPMIHDNHPIHPSAQSLLLNYKDIKWHKGDLHPMNEDGLLRSKDWGRGVAGGGKRQDLLIY